MSHSWSLLQSSKECTNTLTLLISVSAFPSIPFILRGMYQFNFFTPLTGVCVWSPQPDTIEPLYLCACVFCLLVLTFTLTTQKCFLQNITAFILFMCCKIRLVPSVCLLSSVYDIPIDRDPVSLYLQASAGTWLHADMRLCAACCVCISL